MFIYMLSGGTTYISVVVDKFASQAKVTGLIPGGDPLGLCKEGIWCKKKKKKQTCVIYTSSLDNNKYLKKPAKCQDLLLKKTFCSQSEYNLGVAFCLVIHESVAAKLENYITHNTQNTITTKKMTKFNSISKTK